MTWRAIVVVREIVWWLEGPRWEQRRRRPAWLVSRSYVAGKALERYCVSRTGRTIYGEASR